ncbi:MAG: nitrogenase component 1 [Deltaproteobacteria bacterium]|nr:nitrogenase component 1 [Deltaproteobacteria bacterium]
MFSAPPPLDSVLSHLAEKFGTRSEGPARLRPTAEGSLELAWGEGSHRRAMILELAGAASREGPVLGLGAWRLIGGEGLPRGEASRRQLEAFHRRLTQALEAGFAPWLAPELPGEPIPFTPEAIGDAIAGLLPLGRPFWSGWCLRALEEAEGEAVRFLLEDEGGAAGEVLLRETGEESEGFALAGGRLIPQGPLEAEVFTALTFLLLRTLGGRQGWARVPKDDPPEPPAGPPPEAPASEPSPESGGEPARQRQSLISACYRAGVDPHASSRFFSAWGDADTFGLTAEANFLRDSDPMVLHASRECAMGTGALGRSIETSFRPWRGHDPRERMEIERVRVTGLDETISVTGGERTLAQIVDQTVRRFPGTRPRVMEGCEFHMVGDAPEAACRRCVEPAASDALFLEPVLAGFEEPQSRNWWHKFLERVQAQEGAAAALQGAPRINLVGYGPAEAPWIADLAGTLERHGLALGEVVLPYRGADAEARFGQAALTLVSPWEPIRHTFTRFLEGFELPYLELALPYGPRGLRRWLEAIHRFLGRDLGGEAGAASALPGLRASEQPIRIGVLFDQGSFEEVLDPRFFYGASVEELLDFPGAELVLVQLGGDDEPTDASGGGPRRLRVEDEVELARLVADASLDLVYCDHNAGREIWAAGAAPVGIQLLEMGEAGHRRGHGRLRGLLRRLDSRRRLAAFRGPEVRT